MSAWLFFWYVFRSALITTGGSGNIPVLHDDLVSHGLATNREFSEALAVGQISPGPSGLWVVSLGYFMGGVLFALLAAVGVSIPPVLVVAVDRFYARHREHPAVEGFVRGISIAVVSVSFVVMAELLVDAHPDAVVLLLSCAAFAIALSRKVPILFILLGAAAVGMLLF